MLCSPPPPSASPIHPDLSLVPIPTPSLLWKHHPEGNPLPRGGSSRDPPQRWFSHFWYSHRFPSPLFRCAHRRCLCISDTIPKNRGRLPPCRWRAHNPGVPAAGASATCHLRILLHTPSRAWLPYCRCRGGPAV